VLFSASPSSKPDKPDRDGDFGDCCPLRRLENSLVLILFNLLPLDRIRAGQSDRKMSASVDGFF